MDRDGTLVVDRGYLADPKGLEFIEGVPEALRALSQAGHRLVVITNQSGVGRGLITPAALDAMNHRLHAMVRSAGATLSKIYWCPHPPALHCACRKPKLGLMKKASTELHFDPAQSVVVGDKASDVEFGRRAGAMTIRVGLDPSTVPPNDGGSAVVPTLMDAARLITLRIPARGFAEPSR